MALQMPVYRELTAIESKVFLGLSWRQLLAAMLLAVVCGGGFAALVFAFGVDPNVAMYIIFIPAVPIGAWGWVRPKGLKPEVFLVYVFRHYFERNIYLLDGRGSGVHVKSKPSIKER